MKLLHEYLSTGLCNVRATLHEEWFEDFNGQVIDRWVP